MHVYLLRDEQLVAVARSGHTAQDALNQLSAGPTRGEAAAGVDTAVPPRPLMLVPDHRPGTAVVDVSDAFVALAGRRQVLAVAQLVWTMTDLCCFREVQVRLDGRSVALPTDTGMAVGPVERADYTSTVPELR